MDMRRSSRFARLQNIQCAIAGKNLYMRFRCSTGDAMGMNMVSKGVQNVLDFLQDDFPDMDVIGISGKHGPLYVFLLHCFLPWLKAVAEIVTYPWFCIRQFLFGQESRSRELD